MGTPVIAWRMDMRQLDFARKNVNHDAVKMDRIHETSIALKHQPWARSPLSLISNIPMIGSDPTALSNHDLWITLL